MSCDGFQINIESGDPPVVVVAGEVNYECAPRLVETFSRLQRDGRVSLALDCRSVDFIDSSGIGAIVHAAQAFRNAGGSLKLLSATTQFVHALQISGFAQLLDWDPVSPPRDSIRAGQGRSIATGTWHQTSFSIPLRADSDGLVRRRVTDLAESMPFTSDDIDDIRLAVGEAVSNAIRHGCPKNDEDRLTVRCVGDTEKLVVEIHNPGQPFDPDSIPIPDPALLREGGMGIFFMRASMDQVNYNFDETGTTVIMTKFVGAEDAR